MKRLFAAISPAPFVISVAMALFLSIAISAPASAENNPAKADDANILRVQTDYAMPLPLEGTAASVVIGNPVIADVSVRDDSFLFINGRSPGRTNLLIYDAVGDLIDSRIVVVTSSQEFMTLHRGNVFRGHYDCQPRCETVLRIDDNALGFAASSLDGYSGLGSGGAAPEAAVEEEEEE